MHIYVQGYYVYGDFYDAVTFMLWDFLQNFIWQCLPPWSIACFQSPIVTD